VPGLAVTGGRVPRLPNTLHVRFPGTTGRQVLARAPSIAASTGSACHEGTDHPSPVLRAMGLETDDALGAVRLSLGRSTTEADVESAVQALGNAWWGATHG
jgi:cysteine desulfurase